MQINMKLLVALWVLLQLSGCAVIEDPVQPDDPAYAPIHPSRLQPPVALNGAIYQSSQHVSFFVDRTARQVGDVLTITLSEATTATKETETEISKDSSVSVPNPTIFGQTPSLRRLGVTDLSATIDSDVEFTGEADSDQSNSLQGTITVTVTEVLPNGVLKVRGEKWMRLNRGDEYIRLTGMVRPEDIGTDNTVPSTRVADARIAYSQTGELADANKAGFLTRFFMSPLWPF